MKHETVGKKASTLKELQLETEKIMTREKDRAESRRDRKSGPGNIGNLGDQDQDNRITQQHNHDSSDDLCIWDQHANFGYGGFIAMAVKRSRAEEQDETAVKRVRTEGQDEEPFATKGKGKGKGNGEG